MMKLEWKTAGISQAQINTVSKRLHKRIDELQEVVDLMESKHQK
jgi:hypothetical protein